MKQKLYIILLAATMVFAISCQQGNDYNTELPGTNHLKVSVQGIKGNHWGTKTRATDSITAPADTLWLNDSLYVEAVVGDIATEQTPTTRATPVTNSNQITALSIVMFNTNTLKWSASSVQESGKSPMKASVVSGTYLINPPYAWVEEDPYYRTLIAMSPYHDSPGFALSSSGQTLGVTVPADVSKHYDLCVSDIAINKDVLYTIGSNSNLQKFEMGHMMTAVGFEVAGYDLMLTGVKLTNINSKATLTLHNHTWSTPTTPIDFTAKIDANQWLNSEHVQTTNPWRNITPNDGYMMMLPQSHTDNMKLEFTFTGRNGQSGGTYTMPLNKILAAGASNSDWKPGTKITYRLRLKTRPAVQINNAIIDRSNAGSTSPVLSIITSTDDNLTFSWTASWLGMYRGTNTTISNPESNGYFTPFTTGVNNWTNVKFFARSENKSTVADRIAEVTVTGTKSGVRTFKVTHIREVLELNSNQVAVSWHPQRASVAYKASAPPVVSGLPSWCTATVTGNEIQFNFALLFDLDTRTATATVKSGSLSKTVALTQKSSGTGLYSLLNRNGSEVYVDLSDSGYSVLNYSWNDAKSLCSKKGSDWRLPLDHELTIVWNNINPRYSEYKFRENDYWSADYYSSQTPIYVDMTTGKKVVSTLSKYCKVRCVRGRQ